MKIREKLLPAKDTRCLLPAFVRIGRAYAAIPT